MSTTEQFCDDLIQEILLKLPVKTLIRLKGVSKTWLYIITSHKFVKRHFDVSVAQRQLPGNKNPKSLFFLRVGCGPKRDTYITSMSLTPQLECTVHDNIYLPYLKTMDDWAYRAPLFSIGLGLYCVAKFCTPVAIWNPATKEIKSLPPAPFHGKEYHYLVFGHAEFKDDRLCYKVVLLSCRDWPYFRIELYDSSSNSWKVLGCDFVYTRRWHCDEINFNGTLHLLSPGHKKPYIITFDYNTEVFGRMEVPDRLQIHPPFGIHEPILSLYDDRYLSLAVFWTTEGARNNSFFDVWIMREYGVTESWSKECTTGPLKDTTKIVNYWKSIGGISSMRCDRNKVYISDCASSAVISLPVNLYKQDLYVFEHTESLISINGAPDERRTQKLFSIKGHTVSSWVRLFISRMKKYCRSKLCTSKLRN
ncbi:unnamed protein product [Rhodiola kirilowii]